jgi:hypothetical protein
MDHSNDNLAARLLIVNEKLAELHQRLNQSNKMKEQSLELFEKECEDRGIVDLNSESLPHDLRQREQKIRARHSKADNSIWEEIRQLEEEKAQIHELVSQAGRRVIEDPAIPSVSINAGTIHVDTEEGQDRLLTILCQESVIEGKSYAKMRNDVLGFLSMNLPPAIAERLEGEFKKRFSGDEAEFLTKLKIAGGKIEFKQDRRKSVPYVSDLFSKIDELKTKHPNWSDIKCCKKILESWYPEGKEDYTHHKLRNAHSQQKYSKS